jgi:hypothetical protein
VRQNQYVRETQPIVFILGVRDRYRGGNVEVSLDNQDLAYRFLPGIDGRTLTDTRLATLYSEKLTRISLRRRLSPGEIACFLGHKRAVRHFLKTPYEWAVVLEDDVSPDLNLESFVAVLPQVGDDPAVVQFHVSEPDAERLCESPMDSLPAAQRLDKPRHGTTAYAINRKAAMIAHEAYRRHKVDSVADWPFRWKHKVQFWWIPNLSRNLESPNAESTIGSDPQAVALAAQVTSRAGMIASVLPRFLGLTALKGALLGLPFLPLLRQDFRYAIHGLGEMTQGMGRRIRSRRPS